MKPVVDLLKFAKKSESIEGELTDFPRLIGEIIDSARVRYRLKGLSASGDEPMLSLSLTAEITAICQRCLEAMDLKISLDKRYRLAPESQIPMALDEDDLLDETTEILPIDYPVYLGELIEDELMLALPSAPKHDDCEFIGQQSSQ